MSLSDLDENPSAREGVGKGPQTGGVAGAVGAVSAADALMLARRSGFKLEVDGDDLAYEVPDDPVAYSIIAVLRHHKPEIFDLLRGERRAVVSWIANNFQSSPLGRCAHCGGDRNPSDPCVALFCGTDHAELHAGCYPAWVALRESEARAALGIDPPDKQGLRAGQSIPAGSG
jgi:hypothetical protein